MSMMNVKDHKKPVIIGYYNQTKGGVDRLDQLLSAYTCKRKTNRWPLALFYNILDISAVTAQVIFLINKPEFGAKS